MPTKIDSKWHREQVKLFKQLQPEYETYAKVLENVLKAAGDIYAPLCIVQSRAKSIPSFAEKAIRKAHKYKEPTVQITDLCGARIITHFQDQAERICQFIKDNFDVDEANSLDVASRLRVSEFGYRSVHYIITPKSDEILGVKIPKEVRDKKAEIQIRTLLQHTWADISHDRIYKTPMTVPKLWQREVYRLAAIMEKADDAFGEMAGTIDYFTNHYGAMLSEAELKQESAIMETVFHNETQAKAKPKHALRLARLVSGLGEWQRVKDLLHPYAGSGNAELLLLYGHAICQLYQNQPRVDTYTNGIDKIKFIARPDEPVQSVNNFSQEELPDPRLIKQRAEALYLLGIAYRRLPKFKKAARDVFYMAHQLDGENPYYFAAYIEFELYLRKDTTLITLLQPAILKTLEKCREHIRMGIEQVQAHLTIGRLLLIMGEVEKSLGAYSKAVDLCLSGKVCVPMEIYADEEAALIRLNHGNKVLPQSFEWIRILLLMVKALKYENKTALNALKAFALYKKDFNKPVTLVAGGAEMMSKAKLPVYENYLMHALQGYEGTVISGGTTSGIPGLVGLATEAVRRNKSGQFRLLGYLPRKLPADAKVDENYDKLIRTPGNKFSLQELMQYWIDLIAQDIDPSQVLMLGVNGGRISDLEYRLALALGAKVGLVESSGRAATGILMDEDWAGHPNMLVVPSDAYSVWAFMNQHNPSQLSEEQIEEAARKVHSYYLAKKIEDQNTSDPSMLPWEKLTDTLKNSNRKQVAFMENVLQNAGYGIRPADAPKIFKLSPETIELMAEMEHARWVIERLNDGWTYGAKKDVSNKITPYLVGWVQLTQSVKDWDINAVKKFTEVLADAGFEVFPLK